MTLSDLRGYFYLLKRFLYAVLSMLLSEMTFCQFSVANGSAFCLTYRRFSTSRSLYMTDRVSLLSWRTEIGMHVGLSS